MAQKTQSLLGTLILKEARDLILTLRFTVGAALTVVLAALAAYIGSLDYNARLDSYQTKLKLNNDGQRRTTVYSYLRPTVVRPPEPLSILNHGLEGRLGTDFWISVDTENTEAEGENRGNEYLSNFSEIDLTVIVAVILGLLAFLFTFDAVCGEREAGMLKLIMSYPLSPLALVFSTFVWFVFVTIVPNLATMLPDFTGDRARVHQVAREGLTQLEKEQDEAGRKLKDPRDPGNDPKALYYYAINNNWGGRTAFECHFGDAKYYDRLREFFGQLIPLCAKFAGRRAEVWRQYLRYRELQAALARKLAFLSPTAVFQNTLDTVSGTSKEDYSHFIALAAQYRNTFLEYLARKNAFGSWRWFTGDPDDGDRPWTLLAVGKT